jgi:plasmid stabilization system protein ParE
VTLEILVSREARTDIAEAVAALRDISPALSNRFGAELDRVYSSIAEYPEMYPVVHKTFRRALLRKFPYSVFYIVDESVILIVGVVHQSRDESTWKRRA